MISFTSIQCPTNHFHFVNDRLIEVRCQNIDAQDEEEQREEVSSSLLTLHRFVLVNVISND